jgi:uncharacterized membrane protein YdjX (TVP38/TMEM64 family)
MFSTTAARWMMIGTGITMFVLIPFMLWGAQIEAWTEDFLESASGHSTLIAVVLGSLLASDIVTPVPNSLITTAAGLFLGFVRGTLTSTIGMAVSCIVGYWLGMKFGRPLANRLVGEPELKRLEKLTDRFGYWAIAMSRAVPVLGEAAVLFAGMSRMPMRRFLLVSTLSCLGLSAVYGAAGAFSAKLDSFVLAFCASILVSAIGMFIVSRLEKSGQ